MYEIKSFSFYSEYYDLLNNLPKKDKNVLAGAILDYMFLSIEPELTGMNKAIFDNLKRPLISQKNKAENASKNKIKSKSNQNQNKIKSKSNDYTHQYGDVDVNNILNNTISKSNELEVIEEDRDRDIEEEEETIFNYLESHLGITLSGTNYEQIQGWLEIYSNEILCYAVDSMIASGGKTLNYYFGILKNWKLKNYKNLEEIKNSSNKKLSKVDEAFKIARERIEREKNESRTD